MLVGGVRRRVAHDRSRARAHPLPPARSGEETAQALVVGEREDSRSASA